MDWSCRATFGSGWTKARDWPSTTMMRRSSRPVSPDLVLQAGQGEGDDERATLPGLELDRRRQHDGDNPAEPPNQRLAHRGLAGRCALEVVTVGEIHIPEELRLPVKRVALGIDEANAIPVGVVRQDVEQNSGTIPVSSAFITDGTRARARTDDKLPSTYAVTAWAAALARPVRSETMRASWVAVFAWIVTTLNKINGMSAIAV